MKKILSIILIAVMLLSLTACGNNGGNGDNGGTNNGGNVAPQLIQHDEEGYYDDENYYWLMDGSGYYTPDGEFVKTTTDDSQDDKPDTSNTPVKVTRQDGKVIIEFTADFVNDFDADDNVKTKAISISLDGGRYNFIASNRQTGDPFEFDPDVSVNVKNVTARFMSDEDEINISELGVESIALKTQKNGNTFTFIIEGYDKLYDNDLLGVFVECTEGDMYEAQERVFDYSDDLYR